MSTDNGTFFPDPLMRQGQGSVPPGRPRRSPVVPGCISTTRVVPSAFSQRSSVLRRSMRSRTTRSACTRRRLACRRFRPRGAADLRTILNASGGTVYASLTASGAMFDMVRAIAENVPGGNLVTTVLEHPSAFDAMTLYAQRLGRELRVAPSNATTGGVDVEKIVRLVDKDTVLLNVIYASNISGAKLDIEAIVHRARAIKPDLYIVVDAVQHAPHGLIDLQRTPVDGITIAPYKFFRLSRVRLRLAVRSRSPPAASQACRQGPGGMGSG